MQLNNISGIPDPFRSKTPSGPSGTLRRWQTRVFFVCWLAYAAVYFGRVNISVALPSMAQSLGLVKSQLGFLGSIFFWVYGVGHLINGNLGDRFEARKFIFMGLLAAGAANILFGFTSSLIVMALLWGINGYFQSSLWGPIVKTLSFWFPHEKRSQTAIGISTSMIMGYLLAWGAAGRILAVSSWHYVFIIPGAALLIVGSIWFALIKNHPREIGMDSPNTSIQPSEKTGNSPYSFRRVFRETRLWWLTLACFAQGVIKDGVGLWGPTFLLEEWNLRMGVMTKVILVIPLMNFGGLFLAAWLNKALGNREKLSAGMLLTGTVISLVLLALIPGTSVALGVLLLGFSSACVYGANTILLGIIPMNYARYGRVSSVAGYLDFCSYLAAGCASLFSGWLAGKYGWTPVLIMWFSFGALGVTGLIFDKITGSKRDSEERE